MTQRQISDYFAVEGTAPIVGGGNDGSHSNAEQNDRRVNQHEWGEVRPGSRGRGRVRARDRGRYRGRGGGVRNGERSLPQNNDENGNSHHRERPYNSPPSLPRDASSNLSQAGGDGNRPRDANRAARARIFADVYRDTPAVLQVCPLGSNSSTYHSTLLPPHCSLTVQPSRNNSLPPTTIRVIDGDTYSVAQQQLLDDPSRQGKLCVLNLASDKHPGGGCKGGSLAQEETLCYRSTLYHTLDKEDYYPLAPLAGIYSPGVVVYRQEMRYGFAPFEDQNDWFVLGVVTVAGLRRPQLARPHGPDGEEELATPALRNLLHNKIRQILRIAAKEGQEHIILGAMGCGAFRNPPGAVARAFKTVLEEPEWKGVFGGIVFAVMAGNGRQWLSGSGGGERRGNGRVGGMGREGGSGDNVGGGTDESQAADVDEAGENGTSAEAGADTARDKDDTGGRANKGGGSSPGQRNFDVFRDILDGVIIG